MNTQTYDVVERSNTDLFVSARDKPFVSCACEELMFAKSIRHQRYPIFVCIECEREITYSEAREIWEKEGKKYLSPRTNSIGGVDLEMLT